MADLKKIRQAKFSKGANNGEEMLTHLGQMSEFKKQGLLETAEKDAEVLATQKALNNAMAGNAPINKDEALNELASGEFADDEERFNDSDEFNNPVPAL